MVVVDATEALCFRADIFELECLRAVDNEEAFAGNQVNCISVRCIDNGGLVETVLSVVIDSVHGKASESLLLDDVDRFGFDCCHSATSVSVVVLGGGDCV